MHMDPATPYIVATLVAILVAGVVAQRLRQPYVITYLLVGLIIGPDGLRILTDQTTIARLGEFGVVLLLFFAGLEFSLPRLVSSWRVPIFGTLAQIAVSVSATGLLGLWFGWPWPRSLLLGFVVSLSSTAVVLKLMTTWGESNSPTGRDVIGILLSQDILIIPMLLTLSLVAGDAPSWVHIAIQIGAGLLLIALMYWLLRAERIVFPIRRWLRSDRELELAGALTVCFGSALLTALAGLSAALGGFVAGLVIASTDERDWLHDALTPFYFIFVALFFLSIGMLIDVNFVWSNIGAVLGLAGVALVSNTLINALVLHTLGRSWEGSIYGAALLATIGELSFVLAAVGRERGIIADYGYALTVAVIAVTLAVSPVWVVFARGALSIVARHRESS